MHSIVNHLTGFCNLDFKEFIKYEIIRFKRFHEFKDSLYFKELKVLCILRF